MTDIVEQEVTEEVAKAPELTINDLVSLRAIIDLASSRGAYKTIEMVAVGQTYTKLATFLDHITKQAEAAQAVEAAATEGAE
jgi:hypothetical protein